MFEDEGNKEETYDFDAAGEAPAYISLDQAVLYARRLARQDDSRYLQRLGWNEIVWTEISADRREDSYRVVLQFRRPARGLGEEQTGEEEFLFDLAGSLQDRQVLLWPEGVIGDGALDPGTTTAEGHVSATPVPKDVDALREPGAPVTPDIRPEAVKQSLEPATPVSEGVALSGIPATDTSASPAEEPEFTPDTTAAFRCPHCQAEYHPNQKFCIRCGGDVDQAVTAASPTAPVPTRPHHNRTAAPPTRSLPFSPAPQIGGWLRRQLGGKWDTPTEHPTSASRPTGKPGASTPTPPRASSSVRDSQTSIFDRPIIRIPVGVIVALWGAFLLLGAGVTISEGTLPVSLLILAGGVVTTLAAGILLGWDRVRLRRVVKSKLAVLLSIGGFALFAVAAMLTAD